MFLSSLPLAAVIIFTVVAFPVDNGKLFQLAVGYASVVVGQSIFLVGIDQSILPIGKLVGSSLAKLNKMVFVLLFGFIFGVLATAAEPAVTVLAGHISKISPAINAVFFVFLLSFGTGIFVGLGIYRIIRNIDIKYIFLTLYLIIFILVIFVPNQYVSLGFDAGGAATGAVSVPFILSLGLGISHTMSKSKSNDESFGIIGLAVAGSIISVFVFGIINGRSPTNPYTPEVIVSVEKLLLDNLLSVAISILPIVLIFLVFQFFFIKLPKKQIRLIVLSSFVVFVGLYIFLTGIGYGFSFAGKYIGEKFTDPARPGYFKFFLIPVGFALGFAITVTEPAVLVLSNQVEELTNGHIQKKVIKYALGIAIGLSGTLAIIRILLNINILWFLVPLYAAAAVLLFFTPKLFIGLAFDSGGAAAGAITSAYLTPLGLGASQSLGQDALTSGFGIVAFITGTPLIIIQVLGILYDRKMKKAIRETESGADELVILDDENNSEPIMEETDV